MTRSGNSVDRLVGPGSGVFDVAGALDRAGHDDAGDVLGDVGFREED